ncbi:Uncharacterised protein [Mycobacteroides abscessus subsp. abscessus]|nr:Uncharacterised protein [Mycobacteroides abscessus subsp. abscessus]
MDPGELDGVDYLQDTRRLDSEPEARSADVWGTGAAAR